MKKFIKLKISGTAKLCWAEEVKFEFGIHFLGQKSQLTVPDLGQNVAEDRPLVVSRHREGLTEALRL